MEAPSEFCKRLERQHQGRLRIRWSSKAGEYHLEEKVGRASLPPIRIEEGRDDLIRARDGYAFVLAVRPGDRMPCPRCRATLKVPVFEVGEVRCSTCSAREDRNVAYKAAYWPLGESLLEYLRKIDPLTGGIERVVGEADAYNRKREATQQRDLKNLGESAILDDYSQLMGIPMVGYTGH